LPATGIAQTRIAGVARVPIRIAPVMEASGFPGMAGVLERTVGCGIAAAPGVVVVVVCPALESGPGVLALQAQTTRQQTAIAL